MHGDTAELQQARDVVKQIRVHHISASSVARQCLDSRVEEACQAQPPSRKPAKRLGNLNFNHSWERYSRLSVIPPAPNPAVPAAVFTPLSRFALKASANLARRSRLLEGFQQH